MKLIGKHLVLLGLMCLTITPVATADNSDRDRSKEMTQLREQLSQAVSLSPEDFSAMEPELNRYMARQRDRSQLQQAVKSAYQMGCRGECMGTMVHSMNQAMAQGSTAKQARSMCSDALGVAVKERERTRSQWGDKELGEQLRQRVESRIAKQVKTQKRSRQQGSGKAGPGPGGPGGPGGGGGGGGGGGK
jgi:hypothetical protein